MSCDWCVHWMPERDPKTDEKTGNGKCTLNPAWVDTKDSHFCGQIQYGADKYGSGSTAVHRMSKQWRVLRSEQNTLRESQRKLATEKRLLAAEKKLMKLADANLKKD